VAQAHQAMALHLQVRHPAVNIVARVGRVAIRVLAGHILATNRQDVPAIDKKV